MIGMFNGRQAFRGLLLMISAVVILQGCSSNHSLIGTWSYDRTPKGADFGTRFRADGTYEEWFRGSRINVTGKGTYKLEGNRLTMMHTEGVLTSGKASSTPSVATTSHLKWISDDKIEMSDEGGTVTYTRRKQ